MITSWKQFEASLADDEPLPLLAIRGNRPPRHPLLGTMTKQKSPGPLDHRAARQEFAALVRSLRDETTKPSVLEALIMDSPQTIGSIAAATALDVETVDETIQQLAEAGLVRPAVEDGVERVALTIPPAQ